MQRHHHKKIKPFSREESNNRKLHECKKRKENMPFKQIGVHRVGKRRLLHHTGKDLAKEFEENRASKASSVGVLPPLVTAV